MSLSVNPIAFDMQSKINEVKKKFAQGAVSDVKTKEEFVSSKNLFTENLTRGYNPTGFLKGCYTCGGTINGKDVYLIAKPQEGYIYKGSIGGNKAEIKETGKSVCGKIGDKEFNVKINNGFFGQYSINGIIDGKEIKISRDTPTSEAKGENDILTLAVSMCGYALSVKDGKFDLLEMSKERKRRAEQASYRYL